MSNDRAIPIDPVFAGWRIMRSDEGRWWASRETPFPEVAEVAGAHRTVDADDAAALVTAITAQERMAEAALQ